MRGRLAVPAAVGVVVVVVCVVAGVRGIEPLLAFGLGAFAAASAGRALVLSVRGASRSARPRGPSARAILAGWRGLVGRANGGMVVHIGVVVIAVGLAAATRLGHRGELHCWPGQTTTIDGHLITFVERGRSPRPYARPPGLVLLNDHGPLPRRSVSTAPIPSRWARRPSTPTSGTTSTSPSTPCPPAGAVGFGVAVQPLVSWLWVGGLILVRSLSAVPGRRRRPTDPVSAPVVVATTPRSPEQGGPGGGPASPSEPEPRRLPVGAGEPG